MGKTDEATETENLKQYEVVITDTRQTLQYLEQILRLFESFVVYSSLTMM